MHQPMQDESLTLTNSMLANPAARLLHPNLRRALGVLDARLDDELARYRRYRAGLKVAPSSVAALQRSLQVPILQLPISELQKETPSVTVPHVPVSTEASVSTEAVDAVAVDEDITLNQTPAENVSPIPPLPPRTPLSFQNDLPPDASSALVIAAAQDETNEDPDALLQADDLGQSGFITDEHFAADGAAPNDYLESSEELLRSLAEEEATVAAEKNVLEGLLTPFGVGSMLLMLLGSGMFGYLIMNPASLSAVKNMAMKVATFRSNFPSGGTQVASVSGTGMGAGGDNRWMSNAPALDSNEFMNLSLGNISALRTRPGGTLSLTPPSTAKGAPLQQLEAQPGAKNNAEPQKEARESEVVITGLTPLEVQPIKPPAPAIAKSKPNSSGGLFSGSPVKIAPVLRPVAPSKPVRNDVPARPAKSYEPPAPSYQPPALQPAPLDTPAPVVNPAPISAPSPLPVLTPPAPVLESPSPIAKPVPSVEPAPVAKPAPVAVPEPKGDYRVVAPYTNDAALESAQDKSPNASFRNLDDGAYIQYGNSYGSKAEAEAEAAKLRDQGVEVEIK